MYEIVKETDAISQILPETVNRLLTLREIHERGKSEIGRQLINIFAREIALRENASRFQLLTSVKP